MVAGCDIVFFVSGPIIEGILVRISQTENGTLPKLKKLKQLLAKRKTRIAETTQGHISCQRFNSTPEMPKVGSRPPPKNFATWKNRATQPQPKNRFNKALPGRSVTNRQQMKRGAHDKTLIRFYLSDGS